MLMHQEQKQSKSSVEVSENESKLYFATEAQYDSLSMHKKLIQQKSSPLPTLLNRSFLITSHSSQKNPLVPQQLQTLITKLHTFVQDIDSKIQNRVQLVKQVYVNALKEEVRQMFEQLKQLRAQLDNEVMKERANEKMFYLEEERDFFRHQVIKLNQQMNKMNEENKLLKRKVDEHKNQLQNYKQVVHNLQTKILRNQNLQKAKLLNPSLQPNRTQNPQSKHRSSTLSTKPYNSKTERQHKPNTLQTIQDRQIQSQRQLSKTSYRMSKSYQKLPADKTIQGTVSYPKIVVEQIGKIQGYGELLQRQRVIDQCINQLKKEIYYRNLKLGERQQGKIRFNESETVKFNSFTKTDKKELIIKILSNESLLNDFYQFLFNNSITNPSSIESTNELINRKLELSNNKKFSTSKTKFTDHNSNTRILNTMKEQFSKRMLNIKNGNVN